MTLANLFPTLHNLLKNFSSSSSSGGAEPSEGAVAELTLCTVCTVVSNESSSSCSPPGSLLPSVRHRHRHSVSPPACRQDWKRKTRVQRHAIKCVCQWCLFVCLELHEFAGLFSNFSTIVFGSAPFFTAPLALGETHKHTVERFVLLFC